MLFLVLSFRGSVALHEVVIVETILFNSSHMYIHGLILIIIILLHFGTLLKQTNFFLTVGRKISTLEL